MQHYYLVVGDRDEGPFPDTRLRDFLREGMLTPKMTFREAGSGRQLSHGELVQILAPLVEVPAADGIEYPVSFQTTKQPVANPYGFSGKGNAGILSGRLGLEGMQSRAGEAPVHEMVIVPFAQISGVSVSGYAVSFSITPPAKNGNGAAQTVTLYFANQASANHFAGALPR